tara:strand:- start:8255 stop:8380 length:126 start_codon:yes stop_codon:yes gene_type:complete
MKNTMIKKIYFKKTREYIQNDDNVSKFLAPIKDGLMICIKI